MTAELQTALLDAYNDYSYREFRNEEVELPTDGILGIAYTTYDDNGEYGMQVSYDYINEVELFYSNDKLMGTEKFTVEEFIDEINTCSFDDYYSHFMHHYAEDVFIEE